MSTLSYEEKKRGKVMLAGEFTIFEAARVKPLMLESLRAGKTLNVDLSGVTELDTAGVQLMLMLQREARQSGKTLQWSGHSAAVAQVLDILNLGGMFDAPAAVVWS